MDQTSIEAHPARAVQQLHSREEAEPVVFLRLPTILQLTRLSRSTIYRLIADRQFPRPVQLGRRAVAWRALEVETWSRDRPATAESQ